MGQLSRKCGNLDVSQLHGLPWPATDISFSFSEYLHFKPFLSHLHGCSLPTGSSFNIYNLLNLQIWLRRRGLQKFILLKQTVIGKDNCIHINYMLLYSIFEQGGSHFWPLLRRCTLQISAGIPNIMPDFHMIFLSPSRWNQDSIFKQATTDSFHIQSYSSSWLILHLMLSCWKDH